MLEKSLMYPIDKKMDSSSIIVSVVEAFCKKMESVSHDTTHLLLLTEEVIGLVNAIVYVEDGQFYIEKEEDEYRIHVSATADMNSEIKEQLIEASSDGKNQSYRGVSGKIFKIIDSVFTSESYEAMAASAIDRQMYGSAYPVTSNVWSLSNYYESTKKDTEEWDGYERSILLKLADDVLVSARGDKLHITVIKSVTK